MEQLYSMLQVASFREMIMYTKVEQHLKFNKKRDFSLITPCCGKSNRDGKFVNYVDCDSKYGYCHSCGTTINPPQIFKNENGDDFHWNSNKETFIPVLHSTISCVANSQYNRNSLNCKSITKKKNTHKYIDFEVVTSFMSVTIENNLLNYLRCNYDNYKVDVVKQKYYIGTSKNQGTVFWSINKDGKVQKAKVSFYTLEGRRTNKFEVPYKNDDGYYSCLFGEHLLKNNCKPIILVESEKTAIVASIEFPQYTWIGYGGINGLTVSKMKVLENESIIIIPDMSENAIEIMNKKLSNFKSLNIDATIYDMTLGKSDAELKDCNLYNCDIEDVIRTFF
ncbi:MAG: DUF6371 domain-containing protein [Patiriisocius sp.]|uniref:DUF6371 domain-containing protein n=1 Tax=Patiriisocius sp. TaxID=2822396 RepID=UPI003EF10E5F